MANSTWSTRRYDNLAPEVRAVLASMDRHNPVRKLARKTKEGVSRILFSEVLDWLKVWHKVSVNWDKWVVTGFETIWDQKIGVEVWVGWDTKVMISSKLSAIEKKMNILKKPLRNKRKKPKTYEILA